MAEHGTVQPDAGLGQAPGDDERAAAYRWLSGIFAREPSAEAMAAYSGGDGQTLLAHIGSIAPLSDVAGALAELANDPDHEARARDLAGAFAWLFHGVGGRRGAPPFASVYMSARGLIQQESAAQAAHDLARLDARLAADFAEPPDHVAVQLSMMAELVERGTPRIQAAFLDRRLLPWIPEFRDACIAGDRHGLYGMAARCMVGFLEADRAQLQALTQ